MDHHCTWYSSSGWSMGLQNNIVTTLQHSRATVHAVWDKKWEEPIETAGEREGSNSHCNSVYRSIYSYCNDLNLSWATAWILTDNIAKYILKLWWTKSVRSLPLPIYSKVKSTTADTLFSLQKRPFLCRYFAVAVLTLFCCLETSRN